MSKDYKIEMKGSLWEVVLSSGAYSDYTELHLVFSSNDEQEVWIFLKRYMEDIVEKSDFTWGLSSGKTLAMKWNGEKYLSEKFTGDKENISWGSEYHVANVEIKRLNVIYFNN